MKYFFLFCALLFVPYLVSAQSFSVSVTPAVQSIPLGGTATYSVLITPANGFKATVFLSVSSSPSFRGTAIISNLTPNYPYQNITLQIKTAIIDTGVNTFTITAKNSAIEEKTTCSVSIQKNPQWAIVNTPRGSGFVTTDKMGDICIGNGNGSNMLISHFRNKAWETDTLKVTSPYNNQYNNNPPFIYDNHGNIWFASKGLAMYDGKFTTLFNTTNSGIGGDSIHKMLIQENGYPLCITYEKLHDKYINLYARNISISYFDGSDFKVFTPDSSSQRDGWMSTDVIRDSLNQIWFPKPPNGIVRIIDTTVLTISSKSTPPLLSDFAFKMHCDNEGKVWCLNSSGNSNSEPALSYLNGNTWEKINAPSQSFKPYAFLIDRSKNVWVTSSDGLYKYNGASWQLYKTAIPLSHIDYYSNNFGSYNDMFEDNGGNIWMVTSESIVVFNQNGLVGIPLAPAKVEEQPMPSEGISIFPNPTSTSFTISGNDNISSFRIFNSLGLEVISNQVVSSNKSNIDVSSLSNGLYFVNICTDKGLVVKPIVISH